MESFFSPQRTWPDGPYLHFLITFDDPGYQAYIEAHRDLFSSYGDKLGVVPAEWLHSTVQGIHYGRRTGAGDHGPPDGRPPTTRSWCAGVRSATNIPSPTRTTPTRAHTASGTPARRDSRREAAAPDRRLLPLPTGAEQRLRELEGTAARPGLLWPEVRRRHDAVTHALTEH